MLIFDLHVACSQCVELLPSTNVSFADMSDLVHQFIEITGSSPYLAQQYLDRNDHELAPAVEEYYSHQHGGGDAANEDSNEAPRGLGGVTSGRERSSGGNGIRTLRDFGEGDSDDDKTNQQFFTGGEKLGLQVEGPDKRQDDNLIDQIFKRAQQQMGEDDDRPSARADDPPVAKFVGTGFKLGDGTEPLEAVAGSPRVPSAKVTRLITFWRQGFTVGEGPLHRYDDPANEGVLQELNRGRVPVLLLDVEFGQDVDVLVFKKTDEDWSPPKRKVAGYQGKGFRLGSPVPGEAAPQYLKESDVQSKATGEQEASSEPAGDGDTQIQIRFANGKKASHRFLSLDPVSTIYTWVDQHDFNEANGRGFTLNHAFPVKSIGSEGTIGSAGLKNAVIVQRWK